MTCVSLARSSAVLHTAHPSRRSELPVCSTCVSERVKEEEEKTRNPYRGPSLIRNTPPVVGNSETGKTWVSEHVLRPERRDAWWILLRG